MKYIAFIEIPQANVEQYLEIWKNRSPENIKIIFPPQILSKTENNFSGLVVFEPKDFSDIFNYLEKYKSAGFKISISPIWETTIADLGAQINREADNGWEPINISSEAPWQGVPKFHCLLRRLKEGQRVERRSKR